MAVTTHFGGGISTPVVTATRLSTAGGTVYASTGHFATKLSAPTYNIHTAWIKNLTAVSSNAVTGLATGDVILSNPAYVRFSASGIRTVGTPTVRIKATNVASVTGILSNCLIMFSWVRY